MKELGLRSVRTPKFRVCTTESNHNNSIANSLLDRIFSIINQIKYGCQILLNYLLLLYYQISKHEHLFKVTLIDYICV